MHYKKTFAEYYAFVSPSENLIYFCESRELIEATKIVKERQTQTSIGYPIPHSILEHRKFHTELPPLPEKNVGEWGENIVADLIRRKWPDCKVEHISKSDPRQYKEDLDIIAYCPGKTWRIQVKTDLRIVQTGNLFFEVAESNPNKTWN